MTAFHTVLTRRHMLSAGAFLLSSAALAACSSPAATPGAQAPAAAPTSAPPAAPTAAPAAATAAPAQSSTVNTAVSGKIVYLNGITGEDKLTKKWADDLKAKYPGVTVDARYFASGADMVQQLLVQTAAGSPPDVFTYFQENIPIDAAVQKNLLFAIDDLVKRDNYDLDSFVSQAVELNRWAGKLWAIPRDYGNQQVYYNVDLFKKEGLALPATSWTDTTWTYDKYLEAAKALTKTANGNTTQWGIVINAAWRPWASFVYCNGGTVVDKNEQGVATAFSITGDNAVGGLQFFADLVFKNKVAPPPSGTSTWFPDLGPVEIFATNKVGMLVGNPSQVSAYQKITAFQWDVAPLPVGNGGKRGTGGGGTAWAMAKGTKNVEAAWAMLRLITSPQAQYDEVAAGSTTPSRTAVVNSSQFLNPNKPPKNVKSFAEAQGYVVRDPVNVNWPDILNKVVTPQFQLLMAGKADAKTVAATIKQTGDPMWDKN